MKVVKSSGCERILDVRVPAEEVMAAFEGVYTEIARTAKLPGFRPGKAPREILQKHYEKAAQDEVIRQLIPLSTRKALQETKLDPVTAPRITEVRCRPGEELAFRVSVDVRPAVNVRHYRGLKAKAAPVAVEESDVDKLIRLFQDQHATLTSVQRPAARGDYLLCDFRCVADGKEVEKRDRVMVPLTDEVKFPGLVEGLVGLTAPSEKEISSAFPDDFPEAALRGKPTLVRIALHEVKERRIPALDDEFAKDLGPFQTLAELKERVRKDLAAKLESQRKLAIESQLFEELLKRTQFDLPASLVEAQRQRLVDRALEQLSSGGAGAQDLDAHRKNLDERFHRSAQDQVKIYYILARIAELESITVAPDELSARLTQVAQQAGRPLEQVRAYLEERRLLDDLLGEIREEKTIRFLVENAKIEETKPS